MKVFPTRESYSVKRCNSIDSFAKIIENGHTSIRHIKGKKNFKSLYNYLKSIDVNTIVLENNYVNKDFLDNYIGYVATAYSDYSKYCKRLHLFSKFISAKQITIELEKKNNDSFSKFISDYYKGFILIRPIPSNIFGLTILDSQNDSNHIFATRDYKMSIFGREKVIRTLAWQEQDRSTSACATATIWFMQNRICVYPRFFLESPIEITQKTGNLSNDGARLFPNKGLTVTEISESITRIGIDVEKYTFKETETTTKEIANLIHAYSFMGIPIIAILDLKDFPIPGEDKNFHSVAIVGYKNEKNRNELSNKSYELFSDRIKTFYVHDDQIGPFEELKLIEGNKVKTKWTEAKEVRIKHLLVPIYPKIKIPHERIFYIIADINELFKDYLKSISKDIALSWDIRLTFSRDYRERLLSKNIFNYHRKRLLSRVLPNYLWIGKVLNNNEPILELVFDATDLIISTCLIDVVEYETKHQYFNQIPYYLDQNNDQTDIFTIEDSYKWIQSLTKIFVSNLDEKLKKDIIKL